MKVIEYKGSITIKNLYESSPIPFVSFHLAAILAILFIQHFLIATLYKQITMFRKCFSCFHKIGLKLFGDHTPRWQQHLDNYCISNSQRYVWCQMLLDNSELIKSFSAAPKQIDHEIRNTNISSQIVKIISNHYSRDENIFKFCVQLFGSYLKLKYSQIINPSKNTYNRLVKDYEEFTALMIDLLVIYYRLEDREILGENLFYNYTLPCLVISFLFENEDISGTVHYVVKQTFKQSIEKIQFNLQKYGAMRIEEFQLQEELQLNERTLRKYNVVGDLEGERPYAGAIQIIKEAIRVQSPAEKMSLIQGLEKQIQSTVKGFNKKYGIKAEQVQIDYESMTSILMYIVLQANQTSLYPHMQLIASFGPKKKAKTNDKCFDHLNTVLEMLEKGGLGRQSKEYADLSLRIKGADVKSYFDEVSSFDL